MSFFVAKHALLVRTSTCVMTVNLADSAILGIVFHGRNDDRLLIINFKRFLNLNGTSTESGETRVALKVANFAGHLRTF